MGTPHESLLQVARHRWRRLQFVYDLDEQNKAAILNVLVVRVLKQLLLYSAGARLCADLVDLSSGANGAFHGVAVCHLSGEERRGL